MQADADRVGVISGKVEGAIPVFRISALESDAIKRNFDAIATQ